MSALSTCGSSVTDVFLQLKVLNRTVQIMVYVNYVCLLFGNVHILGCKSRIVESRSYCVCVCVYIIYIY